MTLRTAAAAVLARWDSPQWEWTKHGPTADLMADLRAALAQPAAPAQPVAWLCGDGHPQHISAVQTITERRIYGPRQPLYAAPPAVPVPAGMALVPVEPTDAMRLAEMLDAEFVAGRISNHTGRRAATELRGQHVEIAALRAEVAEWEKLRNPVTLHVSLLRGLPCKLDSATFLHLAGDVEVERLRADAARYRWLAQDGERIGERIRAMLDAWDGCDGKAGFDLAIDAAMRDAP